MLWTQLDFPHFGDARHRRPVAKPRSQAVYRFPSTVRDDFDGSVRQIAGDATDCEAFGLDAGALAKIDALHPSGDEKAARYLLQCRTALFEPHAGAVA